MRAGDTPRCTSPSISSAWSWASRSFPPPCSGRPTGAARGFEGDVAAAAKRDLAPGEVLDGEGGRTVYGRLLPARTALRRATLPIGLAHGVRLVNPVEAGESIGWSDVRVDEAAEAVRARRELESLFGESLANAAG